MPQEYRDLPEPIGARAKYVNDQLMQLASAPFVGAAKLGTKLGLKAEVGQNTEEQRTQGLLKGLGDLLSPTMERGIGEALGAGAASARSVAGSLKRANAAARYPHGQASRGDAIIGRQPSAEITDTRLLPRMPEGVRALAPGRLAAQRGQARLSKQRGQVRFGPPESALPEERQPDPRLANPRPDSPIGRVQAFLTQVRHNLRMNMVEDPGRDFNSEFGVWWDYINQRLLMQDHNSVPDAAIPAMAELFNRDQVDFQHVYDVLGEDRANQIIMAMDYYASRPPHDVPAPPQPGRISSLREPLPAQAYLDYSTHTDQQLLRAWQNSHRRWLETDDEQDRARMDAIEMEQTDRAEERENGERPEEEQRQQPVWNSNTERWEYRQLPAVVQEVGGVSDVHPSGQTGEPDAGRWRTESALAGDSAGRTGPVATLDDNYHPIVFVRVRGDINMPSGVLARLDQGEAVKLEGNVYGQRLEVTKPMVQLLEDPTPVVVEKLKAAGYAGGWVRNNEYGGDPYRVWLWDRQAVQRLGDTPQLPGWPESGTPAPEQRALFLAHQGGSTSYWQWTVRLADGSRFGTMDGYMRDVGAGPEFHVGLVDSYGGEGSLGMGHTMRLLIEMAMDLRDAGMLPGSYKITGTRQTGVFSHTAAGSHQEVVKGLTRYLTRRLNAMLPDDPLQGQRGQLTPQAIADLATQIAEFVGLRHPGENIVLPGEHVLETSSNAMVFEMNRVLPTQGERVVAVTQGLRNMGRQGAARRMFPSIEKDVPDPVRRKAVGDWIRGLPVQLSAVEQRLGEAVQYTLAKFGELAQHDHLLGALRDHYLPRAILRGPNGEKPGTPQMAQAIGRWQPRLTRYNQHNLARRFQETNEDLQAAGFVIEEDIAKTVPEYVIAATKSSANVRTVIAALGAVMRDDGQPMALSTTMVEQLGTTAGRINHFPDYVTISNLAPGLGAIHPDAVGFLKPVFEVKTPGTWLRRAQRFEAGYRATAMAIPSVHGLNQVGHQMIWGTGDLRALIPGYAAKSGQALLGDVALNTEFDRYAGTVAPHQHMADIYSKAGLKPNKGAFRSVYDFSEGLLWTHTVRAGQLWAYKTFRDKYLKQGMDPELARLSAARISEIGVGFKRLGADETALSQTFFAWRWNANHLQIAGMLLPRTLLGLGSKITERMYPELTPEAAAQITGDIRGGVYMALLSTFILTQVFNEVLGGQTSFQNSPGHKFDLSIKHLTGHDDYIENPIGRFFNYFAKKGGVIWKDVGVEHDPFKAAGDLLGGLLMPPFTTLLDLQRAEQGPRDKELGTSLATFTPDPFRGVRQVGADVVAGRYGKAAIEGVTGLLGSSAGVQSGPKQGQVPAGVLQERAVDVELATEGLAPGQVTEAQRQHAADVVSGRVDLSVLPGVPLIGQALEKAGLSPQVGPFTFADITKEQLAKFKAVETDALASGTYGPAISKEQQAQDRADQRSPMARLNRLQKQQLFADHPELRRYDQITPITHDPVAQGIDRQTRGFYAQQDDAWVNLDRAMAEASTRLKAGGSLRDWRNARHDAFQKLDGAMAVIKQAFPDALDTPDKRAAFHQRFNLTPYTQTPEDAAYDQYRAVSLDDPKYQRPDGTFRTLQWHQDRAAVLAGMPQEYQDYIKQVQDGHLGGPDDPERFYQQAVNLLDQFEGQHMAAAELYHQMVETIPSVNRMGRLRFESQHPEVRRYLRDRTLFEYKNPLVAQFFGSTAAQVRADRQAGIPLTESPYQQAQQGYQISPLAAQLYGYPPP
jgi:hypothetical protein